MYTRKSLYDEFTNSSPEFFLQRLTGILKALQLFNLMLNIMQLIYNSYRYIFAVASQLLAKSSSLKLQIVMQWCVQWAIVFLYGPDNR